MVIATAKQAHINPVYGSYFADPFVWKHQETYYAIGTGAAEAGGQTVGKVFPILQSTDFYQWRFASSALVRPDVSLGGHFWAPTVAQADGKFFLYYSVGHGTRNHQLRVAVGQAPQGPYVDVGGTLLEPLNCPFAIDPYPFRDEDGQWYLFYARDFLDASDEARAGTGLMVARMKSMTELADDGVVVLRPRSDWQRVRAKRPMYGRVWDWHSLEKACVCKQAGKYYCFYSGGRRESESYGVDYGVASQVAGPYSDAGNEVGPRVLRGVPDHVLGPGHNCTIAGPDGETEYMVYHAWNQEMKTPQMFIDRLVWGTEGPRCEGPTWGAAFQSKMAA